MVQRGVILVKLRSAVDNKTACAEQAADIFFLLLWVSFGEVMDLDNGGVI